MSDGKELELKFNANLNQQSQLSDEDLCRIKDFKIGDLPKNSSYVRPFRAAFIDERNNNPVRRFWDAIESHVSR